MLNINPLLLVGGVIGAVTALLIFAYVSVKDKKTAMGFERTMADGEILRRLFAYAKPYWAKFLLVLFLMLFSIAYDIISPLIVGAIEELVAADFTLSRLFASVYRKFNIQGASHLGRHLFVSKLVNSGVNICIVQKLANHKNISTTQHYFNYNDQMLANAVENVRI